MSLMKKAVGGAHNLIFFLCLVAAWLLALTPTVAALVLKFLVPEWFFVAVIVIAVAPTRKDTCIPQLGPSLSVFSPRPPPIQ
jgi:hypothetical protein